jgi:hypothetical protein
MSLRKHRNQFYRIPLVTITLIILFVGTQFGQSAVSGAELPVNSPPEALQDSSSTTFENTIYLPTVLSRHPLRSIFGVELDTIRNGTGLDLLVAAGDKWARSGEVAWMDVQPVEGMAPDWDALAETEREWEIAAETGLTNIAIIDRTPEWARTDEYPDYPCGPVREDKLDEFASFMYQLVYRYSQPPWNIKYWEFWNEPDVAPEIVYVNDSPIGCWGDQDDPNYGGWYYAEMLKKVYPEVKRADPDAKVLVGGLLLDCDPRDPDLCVSSYKGEGDRPPRFLRGILENGGKDYFDGVSFHAFELYYGGFGMYGNANWNSIWNETGPVILSKVDYLKGLLNEFNATGKLLLSTENALLLVCDDDPNTEWPPACPDQDTWETTKAYYVAKTFAAATREKLHTNIWLSIYGWRDSGLLATDNTPLPAYHAYMFSANQLFGADYVRDISEYPGAMGYEFRKGSERTWVIWSLDGSDHTIQLPSTPNAGFHVDGSSLGVAVLNGTSLTVTLEPIYLNW